MMANAFGGIQPQTLLGGVTQAQVPGNTTTSGGPLKDFFFLKSGMAIFSSDTKSLLGLLFNAVQMQQFEI